MDLAFLATGADGWFDSIAVDSDNFRFFWFFSGASFEAAEEVGFGSDLRTCSVGVDSDNLRFFFAFWAVSLTVASAALSGDWIPMSAFELTSSITLKLSTVLTLIGWGFFFSDVLTTVTGSSSSELKYAKRKIN